MTILSAITSLSPSSSSKKSLISSSRGASLSMGSNSVACGSCDGGYYTSSYTGIAATATVNVNVDVTATTSLVGGLVGGLLGGGCSC